VDEITTAGHDAQDAAAVGSDSASVPPRTDRTGRKRKIGFIGIGLSTSGRTAAESEEMLAEDFGRC
jgi:hypothetical protein